MRASVTAAHELNSGTRTLLPCGMWNLPRPGIEPMSPALAGRFLTSGPPGKFLPRYTIETVFLSQFSSIQSLSRVRLFATP